MLIGMTIPLTGTQYEIEAGDYRATVTELGAGLRQLEHAGTSGYVLDGHGSAELLFDLASSAPQHALVLRCEFLVVGRLRAAAHQGPIERLRLVDGQLQVFQRAA